MRYTNGTDTEVFRAVITTSYGDRRTTTYYGPYTTKAPATAQINRAIREARLFNLRQATTTYPLPTTEVGGYVEKSVLAWEIVA